MGPGGPSTGGRGWISVRPPIDGPSRARILVGVFAVVLAVLASLALLNVLISDPVPLGEGTGDEGGDQGGSSFQPGEPDGGGQDDGGGGGKKNDPCDPLEPIVRASAITMTILAMLLWVMAVWWRQKKATRVMNGWAIGALLVTLFAVTLLFAWYVIHKICNLDVFDLKSCLEIAHSLRNAFFLFLVLTLALLGFAIFKMRQGGKFWGLWSISGFIFLYLAILGLIGWQVAEDLCERQFEIDEDDIPEPPDDPGPDGGDGDPGDGGDGDPGGGGDGGGGLGRGGGGSGTGSGGGGTPPALPQVSPFALLAVLGVAALITILVLAVKGRQEQIRAAALAAAELEGRAGLMRLFMDTDLESNDNVVAAYRKFLDHAMLNGVPKKAQETPREHARRAAPKMDVAYEDMLPLVDAYSQVRLGDRPLPEDRRKAALLLQRIFKPRTVKTRPARRER